MATYFIWSGAGGSNTGGSWTNAFVAFGSAVTAATADGDIIKVHKTHQETIAAATTYTFANNVSVVCVDKDASDALAVMGTGGFISINNESLILAGAFAVYFYGMTLRLTGASTRSCQLSASAGSQRLFEACSIELTNTGASSGLNAGGGADSPSAVTLLNTTLEFGNAAQFLRVNSLCTWIGGATAGSALTGLLTLGSTDPGGGTAVIEGVDFTSLSSTAALLRDQTVIAGRAVFTRCKLPASYVLMASQTNANLSSGEVFVSDCASGDTHGLFGYANAVGSVVSDTGIYYTTGAAGQSWKIVTTSVASSRNPFQTPTIDLYHAGTSSITPYLEILRDGSTTAFQDDEVWAVFTAKTTSGNVLSTIYQDRMTLLGTPANQDAGAGLGSWTGEAGTAWSGKIDSGSAFTPAEAGHIRARVSVGEPSITVYVDPQIRT